MLTLALGNKHNARQHGFSLLEVIIVLFIIGISTSVGIHYLPSTYDNSVSQDAKLLTQRFQAAQRYAIQHQQTLRWQKHEDGFGFEALENGAFTLPLPATLAHVSWRGARSTKVTLQPSSTLLIEPSWLYSPLLITLDNGVDRLIISRDLHGNFDVSAP